MPTKRSEKREKRKRNQIRQYKNRATLLPADSPGMPESPYANAKEAEEDLDIMWLAWQKHYGVVPDDFAPPYMILDEQSGEMKLAEWVGTYRDLMLEKYTSMERVEPRVKFNLFMLFYANLP